MFFEEEGCALIRQNRGIIVTFRGFLDGNVWYKAHCDIDQ